MCRSQGRRGPAADCFFFFLGGGCPEPPPPPTGLQNKGYRKFNTSLFPNNVEVSGWNIDTVELGIRVSDINSECE